MMSTEREKGSTADEPDAGRVLRPWDADERARPQLFEIEYPAQGDPDLAQQVADLVEPTWVGLDADSWGIDHGTWSVLVHAFPDATVPVVQLSINAAKSFEYHHDLGGQLAPLRDDGVLIIGSGNVVHNLRRIDWSQPDAGFDWARRFDDHVADVMSRAPGELASVRSHQDFTNAAPTPDHFIPLLYLAGLASAAGETAHVLIDGYAMGSLSMTCYTLGCHDLHPDGRGGGSPALPRIPADNTNV